MTQSSKILTVSYGTFSCTLEGFDDTFEAMKEITEYFRTLAAEDRYFGVEPPQTKTDGAAHMTQRGVTRRMNTEENGHGILLRPRDKASVAPGDASLTDLQELAGADQTEATDQPTAAADIGQEDSDKNADAARKNEGPGALETRRSEQQPLSLDGIPSAKATLDPSTAAKLQRIRDIVGQDPATGGAADAPPTETDTKSSHDPSQVEVAETADLEASGEDEPDRAHAPDQQSSATRADPHVDQEDLQAALTHLEDQADHSNDNDPPQSTTEPPAPAPIEDKDTPEPDGTSETAAVPEQPKTVPHPAVRGRVLKLDRADLDAALAASDLDGFGPHRGDVSAAPDPENASDVKFPPIDTRDADDVSRLMAEAEQKMEDPDGTTRRDAFSHLRAAVAARFADKTMQQGRQDDETAQPYRRDLEQAIKPRRPTPVRHRTERPADPSPAPLKLAPDQRVDDVEANARPVMPRRIATAPDVDAGAVAETDFAAFAAGLGITHLPDLLEAAAAHMSFIEGREVFSRPQLMTRVRQADAENFSREEALRGFAQLVQSGKILKIGSGRFQTSETIGYKPQGSVAD